MAELLRYNPKSVRASLHREDFQRFWPYMRPWAASRFLREWSSRVMRSVSIPLAAASAAIAASIRPSASVPPDASGGAANVSNRRFRSRHVSGESRSRTAAAGRAGGCATADACLGGDCRALACRCAREGGFAGGVGGGAVGGAGQVSVGRGGGTVVGPVARVAAIYQRFRARTGGW